MGNGLVGENAEDKDADDGVKEGGNSENFI